MPGSFGSIRSDGSRPNQSGLATTSPTPIASQLVGGDDVVLADILVDGSPSLTLTASSAAVVAVQGAASGSLALAASSGAAVQVQASAAPSIGISGSAAAVAPVQASAVPTISLVAASQAVVVVQANAAGVITFLGNENAVVQVQAVEAGSIALVGASQVVALVQVALQGVLALVGSGSVSVPVAATAFPSLSLVASSDARADVVANEPTGTLALTMTAEASVSDVAAAPLGQALGGMYGFGPVHSRTTEDRDDVQPIAADMRGVLQLVAASAAIVGVVAVAAPRLALVARSDARTEDDTLALVSAILLLEAA